MMGPREGKATRHLVCWYRDGRPADNIVFGKAAKHAMKYLVRQGYSKVASLPHALHRQPA
jgi:hypothetical protein